MFDNIPLTPIFENQILSLRDGLSPSITTLQQIKDLTRVAQGPNNGAACDLFGAILKTYGLQIKYSRDGSISELQLLIIHEISEQFNYINGLKMIESSQLIDMGYKLQHKDKIKTIFSDRCGNQAAILYIRQQHQKYGHLKQQLTIQIDFLIGNLDLPILNLVQK